MAALFRVIVLSPRRRDCSNRHIREPVCQRHNCQPKARKRSDEKTLARSLPPFYHVGTVRQWLYEVRLPLWPSPSMPLVATARVAFVEKPSSYDPPQPFKASPTYSPDEVVTPTAAVYGSSVFDNNAEGGEAHP
jgi:hypothetical protein